MFNQAQNGMSAAAAGIGVAGALGSVTCADCRGDKLKVRMIAMPRIAQDFIQRQIEEPSLDIVNFRHAGFVPRSTGVMQGLQSPGSSYGVCDGDLGRATLR